MWNRRGLEIAGPQTVSQKHQLMRIAHQEFLPAALDQARRLPGAEDAGDGMERGAGHLGDVLPGDGEVDADAAVLGPARLVGEAEDGVGDAPLHLLGGELAQPLLLRLEYSRLPMVCMAPTASEGQRVEELAPEACIGQAERQAVRRPAVAVPG